MIADMMTKPLGAVKLKKHRWNIQAIQRFCVLRTPARIHRDNAHAQKEAILMQHSITIRCTEYTFYLINLYLVTLYTLCSYFLEPYTLVPDPPQPTFFWHEWAGRIRVGPVPEIILAQIYRPPSIPNPGTA
jgi:hypothetical protein